MRVSSAVSRPGKAFRGTPSIGCESPERFEVELRFTLARGTVRAMNGNWVLVELDGSPDGYSEASSTLRLPTRSKSCGSDDRACLCDLHESSR